jgi:pimeloyl-ACP methyl ester carboxylesterase
MDHSYFWITGDKVAGVAGTVFDGPMYVEVLTNGKPATKPNIVLVHGGGGQGTDYLMTPDGRPGWAPLLAEQGYSVYVVDRPGHGRSPYDAGQLGDPTPTWGAEILTGVFLGDPAGPPLAPNTQWPGALDGSDDVFAQFAASQGPLSTNLAEMHARERDRLVSLLERIGPSVILTHSAGGPCGFLTADARPDLVTGIVAVEVIGPPFLGQPATGITLPWGLANAPMNFEPPAQNAADIALVIDESGPVPMALQAEPARTLPNLAQVPIAIVTAEASPFSYFDGHLTAFLDQVGCQSTLLRLAEQGIHGNGHGMMMEKNNADVLAVIEGWISQLPNAGK